MIQLQDAPTGAIVRHPAWPRLYWEIVEQLPLLTRVRLIGSDSLATLYARNQVELVEEPEPADT
jgi:hypothetical protein